MYKVTKISFMIQTVITNKNLKSAHETVNIWHEFIATDK